MLAALLSGGSLNQLATTPFKAPWLVFGGLLLQIGVQFLAERGLDDAIAFPTLLVSMAAIAVFLVLNLSLPGMGLAGIGALMNLVVITANQAMPVAPRAARSIGMEITDERGGLKHEVMSSETVLPWLADAIAIRPLGMVLSLGDVLLALGLALFVFRAAHQPVGRRRATGASG